MGTSASVQVVNRQVSRCRPGVDLHDRLLAFTSRATLTTAYRGASARIARESSMSHIAPIPLSVDRGMVRVGHDPARFPEEAKEFWLETLGSCL